MKITSFLHALTSSVLLLALVPADAQTLPPIPTTHPRILLTGTELARFQADLANQRPAMKRFKQQMVDLQLQGANIYGYEPWYSAFMGVVSGQAQYCTHAIQATDALLDEEIALIQAGENPVARYDSYLYIGEMVGGVALVYDWCHSQLTAVQKLRWGNYADRFVDNVWHQDTHHWGIPTAANNYSWDGPLREPGSSWSVDDPNNNYYYSFMRATMLWGLVSKNEPGRTKADEFLNRIRFDKIQNQLAPAFNAQVVGGGSREGTGYGTAMRELFNLYYLWEKTTGERIADLTTHTQSTMPYMLHVLSPKRDFMSPIGDHARDETAAFYDYQRNTLLALASLYRGTPMARRTRDFLAASTVPQMGDRFNWIYDVLYDFSETVAPADLNTAYFATGTGHFFTRSSWATNATWVTFLTGAYTQSHAHQDGLSFLLFKNGWLVTDANTFSYSGIEQDQHNHALVRQVAGGSEIGMKYGGSAVVNAMADKSVYTYVSSSAATLFDTGGRSERELLFIKPDILITFDRVNNAGNASSTKIYLLPIAGQPVISGRTATYSNGTSNLKIFALAPAASQLSAVDMVAAYPDPSEYHPSLYREGYRFQSEVTTAALTHFANVLSVDGAVSAATSGANAGVINLTLADGRTVTVTFNLNGPGGQIEIRSAANQVLLSEALPNTVTAPSLLMQANATLTVQRTGSGTGAVASAPAGITCGADCTESLPVGTAVTLSATPNAGSVFAGWTGVTCAGGNTVSPCTFNLAADATVAATFNLAAAAVSALHDLNDDGKSDIVWRNGSTGENWYWAMNGITITAQGPITTLPMDWQIQSTAVDFDGDGKSDILLRNMTTGQPWVWFMNGNSIIGGGGLPTLSDLNWTIAGTGDLNGDGKGDVIWRNTSTGANWWWALNGTAIINQGQITGLPVDWAIQSTLGDFNGDGKTDILWRNITTGQPWMWMMDGNTIINNGPLPTLSDLNWIIAGTGDLNGDGKHDVVWRNTATGANWYWSLNGTTITAQGPITTLPVDWQIQSTSADFDGDGKADILLRNMATGQPWVWIMNGNTITGGGALPTLPDMNWQIRIKR